MSDVALKPRIYIDSNIFIEAFEGTAAAKPDILALFGLIEQQPGLAWTSEFTLAEVLGRQGDFPDWGTQKSFYAGLLVRKAFIALSQVSLDLLERAADFRHEARLKGRSLRLPDAIHVASAQAMRCEIFLSADLRIAGCLPPSLRLATPRDVAALNAALVA